MNLGIDIGRRHDATIIAGAQLVGDVWHVTIMKELANTPYSEQEFVIKRYLGRAVRCRIDETGIGNMLAENLKAQYGSKVEPITFTNSNKDEMITNLKVLFEQRKIRIPNDERLIRELHDLNRLATPTSVRYDTSATDHHCDRVWALALAVWETDNAADPSRFRNIVTRRRG
jgi:phage FluMu gp28-like protein